MSPDRGRRWAAEERLEEVQRWTARRRVALVLSVLKEETTVAEAARKHGLPVAEIERNSRMSARQNHE